MVGSGTAKICMGAHEALRQDRSLFKLKEHCVGQGAQNAVQCTERKWQQVETMQGYGVMSALCPTTFE
jgi:hypothetical protein